MKVSVRALLVWRFVEDGRLGRLRDMVDRASVRVVRAPGRVNLIGDHTDYHEGLVLPFAIDRDCLVACAPRSDDMVTARSVELEGAVALGVDAEPGNVEPTWGRFVAGAREELRDRGSDPGGVDLAITSTVPAGGGLSSSSALTVALVLAMTPMAFDPRDAARVALAAEVRATGVPGGLMDQLASLFGRAGHALLIDCRDLAVDPIPLPGSLGVIVVHSGLPRALATSAYADRRAAADAIAARLGLNTLRDATMAAVADEPVGRHIVSENARVAEFAAALRVGDLETLGPLMLASHESLRDDFDVSTPELDRLVEMLVEEGAWGARLTGAGFGGCVVALGNRGAIDEIGQRAARRYQAATGLDPKVLAVEAVDGAGAVPAT